MGPRRLLVYDVRTHAAHAAFDGVAVKASQEVFDLSGPRHASKNASQVSPPSAPRHAAEGATADWYVAGTYAETSDAWHELAASRPVEPPDAPPLPSGSNVVGSPLAPALTALQPRPGASAARIANAAS